MCVGAYVHVCVRVCVCDQMKAGTLDGGEPVVIINSGLQQQQNTEATANKLEAQVSICVFVTCNIVFPLFFYNKTVTHDMVSRNTLFFDLRRFRELLRVNAQQIYKSSSAIMLTAL